MLLTGIRVLDLSRLLPGPFASMYLADMGAEVIKVEEPKLGDYARWMAPKAREEGAVFLAVNRNKKSITLNLKHPEGRDIFLRLAAEADVVLETFRPGVVDALGIGYEAVRAVNPRIVYCSISGYGQNGPLRDAPGHDLNYIGIAGLLDMTGRAGEPPVIPGVQVGDLVGANVAVIGILAALVERSRTGTGRYIDVSMTDGVLSWLSPLVAQHFALGSVLPRGSQPLSGGIVCYNVYETKDGRYMALGALEEKFWRRFCELIGREDLIPHQFDPARPETPAYVALQEVFRTRTRDEWAALFEGEDACCTPVLTIEEALQHPQIAARGLIRQVDHPVEGTLRQVDLPIRFRPDAAREWTPPPRFGEHTAEVLGRIGIDGAAIARLREEGVV